MRLQNRIITIVLLLCFVPVHLTQAGSELIATVEVNGATTAVYYDHTDHLGGSSVLTNATGGKEQLLDYFPFGGIRLNEKASAFDEQRKFTGQEYDKDTNLHYYVQRYYNQDIGRFTSQDPVHLLVGDEARFKDKAQRSLEFHLSDPQSLNSYSYVNNNPLKYTDPEGELIPLIIAAYIGIQVGLSAWDAYAAYDTIRDPNADTSAKLNSVGFFALGVFDPLAGGYGGAKRGLTPRTGHLVKYEGKEASVYRGGNIVYDPRHFKNSLKDGVIDPSLSKTPEGISVNINPNDSNVLKYGGPNPITSLPKGLEIVQSGRNPEHFVIRPIEKMEEKAFIELVHTINQ